MWHGWDIIVAWPKLLGHGLYSKILYNHTESVLSDLHTKCQKTSKC